LLLEKPHSKIGKNYPKNSKKKPYLQLKKTDFYMILLSSKVAKKKRTKY
jgi:hypothetical protein